MAKRELLATVCLVTAALMFIAAVGQAASDARSPVVVRTSATTNPIPDYGRNGTQGEKGWYTSAVTVWIIENGTVNYTIDDGEWLPYTEPLVFAENGIFHVEFNGYINETRNKTVKVEVKVDTVTPVTTSSYSEEELKCTLNASDATSGVAKILYRIDGGIWMNYYSPFRPDPGAHSVEYYSKDVAGNSEATHFINFTVVFTVKTLEVGIITGVLVVGLAAFFVVFFRGRRSRSEAKSEEPSSRLE